MLRHLAALLLAAACLATFPAGAGERDSFLDERPGIGEPLRFRDANGGAFRPRALIVHGASGAFQARLPSGARSAVSENRVDLSGAPLLGPLFRETLDVASVREGPLVGPVYRLGDTLVVDASQAPTGQLADLARRHVALSTNLPRIGAVSYRLGRLGWSPVGSPAPSGAAIGPAIGPAIGTAHLVDGALVLASQGGEPAWPSIEALFQDLF